MNAICDWRSHYFYCNVLISHQMVLQILNLASNKAEIERKVHHAIANYAERGLRSLAVSYQVVNC